MVEEEGMNARVGVVNWVGAVNLMIVGDTVSMMLP